MVPLRRISDALVVVVQCVFLLACHGSVSIEEIRALHARGDFASSIEPLRELLEEAPDAPEPNYLYGIALTRSGSPERAIWALRKAAADDRWARSAKVELARASLAAREWESAIRVADELLGQDPDDVDARLLRASAFIESKTRFGDALEDLDFVLSREPANLDGLVDRISVLIALGRIEEAARSLEDLEATETDSRGGAALVAQVCTVRAMFSAERGLVEEATSRFRECRKRHPDSRRLLEAFVAHLDSRGRVDEANRELLATLERDPDDSLLRILLVRRFLSMGRFEDSEAILVQGTERSDPAVASDAWAAFADHHVALGDLSAAAAAYERSLGPREEVSSFQLLALGDLLARAGHDDRALEVAKGIDNDAYRGLIEARVHLNRDDPGAALARLDSVLPVWPNNPGARYWAARAAEQLHRFDRAVEEYRQSVRSDPTFTDAALRLARIEAAEGKGEAAWSAVSRYASEKPNDPRAAEIMMDIASTFGPEQRLRDLAKALSIRPIWPAAIAERARVLGRTNPRQAADFIRTGSGLDLTKPASAPALHALIDLCQVADCASESVELTLSASEAHPGDADLLAAAASALLSVGRLGEARELVDRAVAIDAGNARAHLIRGRCAADEGRDGEALSEYSATRRLDAELVAAYEEPARRLEASGRIREALALWVALTRERPEHARAAYEIARLSLAEEATGVNAHETLREALDWVRRSERFGGGEEAVELKRSILAELQAGQREPRAALEAVESSSKRNL